MIECSLGFWGNTEGYNRYHTIHINSSINLLTVTQASQYDLLHHTVRTVHSIPSSQLNKVNSSLKSLYHFAWLSFLEQQPIYHPLFSLFLHLIYQYEHLVALTTVSYLLTLLFQPKQHEQPYFHSPHLRFHLF